MVDYPTEDDDGNDPKAPEDTDREITAEDIAEDHFDAEWEQFEVDANRYVEG